MRRIRSLDFELEPSAVCIGKFDGIHRGHRLLIQAAKKTKLPVVMFTFESTRQNGIYSQAEKEDLAEKAGVDINLFSITLRYGIDCMVVLPENLKKGEKLKCLWLYHGGSGDHTAWLYHTPLVELAEEKHFAAVLPNVHESCFVNMNIGDAFGTFVGKELPSVIWNMFACISDERQDNYIAGFSNGGYGCLHTALSYPQKFAGDRKSVV